MQYKSLIFLVELGVDVRADHKALTFEQKPWLKSYIDLNTDKRKEAKNELGKEFFKPMNNAVFFVKLWRKLRIELI